jgi:hypothetical protein
MARWLLACVLASLVSGGGASAADQLPLLRSVQVVHGHVVVLVEVSDVRPVELFAATRRAEASSGGLLSANIRLRETIRLAASATGVVRWQSRKRLLPGTYYVQVLALDTAGVTDCIPPQRDCLRHWSNVRRVVVRRVS